MPPARAAVLVLVLAVAACSRQAVSAPVAEPTPSASQPAGDASPVPTAPRTVGTAPLTGEPVTDPAVLARPVVAVKVENSAAARPQAGLEDADIVFEELTEGGVTRFAALFHSRTPDLVGPIRSGRPEDAKVLPAYRAVLFLSGARREVLSQLTAAGVPWLREDGTILHRVRDRRSPHNVFARGADLFSYAEGEGEAPAGGGWTFSAQPPPGAVACPAPCERDPGREITVTMSAVSTTTFRYDPAAAVYRRLQDGKQHQVVGAGQVGADNVVVLGTRIRDGGCCDSAGSRLSETQVVGSGSAVVLRDGRRYDARWSKASPDDHFVLTTADGAPLSLKPGRTWALLAPAGAVG